MNTEQIRQAFSTGTPWFDLLEQTGLSARALYGIVEDLIQIPEGVEEEEYRAVLVEAFYNE